MYLIQIGKGLQMIIGEESVKTQVLEKAVVSSILAGSRRLSEKNRKTAIDNEVKLLRHHRELGHQTPFETLRVTDNRRLSERGPNQPDTQRLGHVRFSKDLGVRPVPRPESITTHTPANLRGANLCFFYA